LHSSLDAWSRSQPSGLCKSKRNEFGIPSSYARHFASAVHSSGSAERGVERLAAGDHQTSVLKTSTVIIGCKSPGTGSRLCFNRRRAAYL
jgi:hypothetical protein